MPVPGVGRDPPAPTCGGATGTRAPRARPSRCGSWPTTHRGPERSAIVSEPTGSPVRTYSSTTACSTAALRGPRSGRSLTHRRLSWHSPRESANAAAGTAAIGRSDGLVGGGRVPAGPDHGSQVLGSHDEVVHQRGRGLVPFGTERVGVGAELGGGLGERLLAEHLVAPLDMRARGRKASAVPFPSPFTSPSSRRGRRGTPRPPRRHDGRDHEEGRPPAGAALCTRARLRFTAAGHVQPRRPAACGTPSAVRAPDEGPLGGAARAEVAVALDPLLVLQRGQVTSVIARPPYRRRRPGVRRPGRAGPP